MSIKRSHIIPTSLLAITILSGAALSSTLVSATDNTDVVDEINITVPVSCSLSGTGMTSHNANIVNGTYQADIGTTTLKAFCNDSNGFAIYAAGYTGNEIEGTNSNKLVGTSASSNAVIDTGLATSTGSPDVSNWAMKLATSSGATYALTLDNGYGAYSLVPNSYTKVAHRDSGTDIGTSATGAELATTYAAYISKTQAADTYTGQVKYTLVHPYDGAAPRPSPPPISTCNTKVPGVTYMQDITVNNKTTILANMIQDAPYYLRDSRDETPYCVSKLADGNVWMLDNLALDLTDSIVLKNVTASNTNATTASITSLKSGNRSAGNQYATVGVSNWTSSYSYSAPLINATNKDIILSDSILGAGNMKVGVYYNYCAASAGSYCYGSGTSQGSPSGNSTEDLCPINWRMPTGGNGNEFQTLYQNVNYNKYAKYKAALSLPLSGYFYDGSARAQGSDGSWWSSTRDDNYYMHSLDLDINGGVYPSRSNGRIYGVSLRCLLKV